MKAGLCMSLCMCESRMRGFIQNGKIYKCCSECGYYTLENKHGLRCYCCGQKFRVKPHGATRKEFRRRLQLRNRFKRYLPK